MFRFGLTQKAPVDDRGFASEKRGDYRLNHTR
jgi:hypothetical protein